MLLSIFFFAERLLLGIQLNEYVIGLHGALLRIMNKMDDSIILQNWCENWGVRWYNIHCCISNLTCLHAAQMHEGFHNSGLYLAILHKQHHQIKWPSNKSLSHKCLRKSTALQDGTVLPSLFMLVCWQLSFYGSLNSRYIALWKEESDKIDKASSECTNEPMPPCQCSCAHCNLQIPSKWQKHKRLLSLLSVTTSMLHIRLARIKSWLLRKYSQPSGSHLQCLTLAESDFAFIMQANMLHVNTLCVLYLSCLIVLHTARQQKR